MIRVGRSLNSPGAIITELGKVLTAESGMPLNPNNVLLSTQNVYAYSVPNTSLNCSHVRKNTITNAHIDYRTGELQLLLQSDTQQRL